MGSFTVTILFAAIAMIGLHTCYSCDPTAMQACFDSFDKKTKETFNQTNPDLVVFCGVVDTAFDCVVNEMDDCPSAMDNIVDGFKTAMDKVKNDCKNKGSIHVDTMEQCPYDAFDKCADRATPADDATQGETCLAFGRLSKCSKNFLDNCPNQFAKDIISIQIPVVDGVIGICHDNGYDTDSAATPRQVVALPLLASVLAVFLRHLL